jgi:hypothetical protein
MSLIESMSGQIELIVPVEVDSVVILMTDPTEARDRHQHGAGPGERAGASRSG